MLNCCGSKINLFLLRKSKGIKKADNSTRLRSKILISSIFRVLSMQVHWRQQWQHRQALTATEGFLSCF